MNKQAKKEILYIFLFLLVVGYFGRLLALMSNPKVIEWPPKNEVQAKMLPTPKPDLRKEFIAYVNEKFGEDSWKAFAILHGTRYCGGENGKHNPSAKNVNDDGSEDWGYWQFNDKWHPEVTRECAKDIKCSTNRAYEMFKHDGSFKQWSAGKCIGV